MSDKKELNPSPKFPSGDYPELSPNPNQREGLINKTGEKPNTQIVNLPKEQEKRCLTTSEVNALIQKYVSGFNFKKITNEGTSLKIDEVIIGLPVVGTFDNVDYHHKHEFDLESFKNDNFIDLITGETQTSAKPPFLRWSDAVNPGNSNTVQLFLSMPYNFRVYSDSASAPVDYTSRSFTVVHDQADVTDNTKICLPENVTAYYGFLSEDGKTFISYWNEVTDEVTDIDSITDGAHTLPIKDNRLPKSTIADAGKALVVNEEGGLEFDNVGGGMSNPMTTPNDIIIGGSNGTPQRLPVGTAGQFLKCGTTGLTWGDVPSGGGTLTGGTIILRKNNSLSYDSNMIIEYMDNAFTYKTASFNPKRAENDLVLTNVLALTDCGNARIDVYYTGLSLFFANIYIFDDISVTAEVNIADAGGD